MDYQQNDFNAYNKVPGRIAAIFSSPLFLAVAVLTSAAALFSFNLFLILGTVAAWLIYYTSYMTAKNPGTPLKATGFTMIHGTARAIKIVYLVISIIIIVCSIAMLIATLLHSDYILSLRPADIYGLIDKYIGTYLGDSEWAFKLSAEYDEFLVELFTTMEFPTELFGFLVFVAMITASVVSLISGIFQLVLSFTFCASLCKFTCSLRDSFVLGTEPKRIKGLGVWFLVLGILYVVASPFSDSAVLGALLIVLYVWYKNAFPIVPDIQVDP